MIQRISNCICIHGTILLYYETLASCLGTCVGHTTPSRIAINKADMCDGCYFGKTFGAKLASTIIKVDRPLVLQKMMVPVYYVCRSKLLCFQKNNSTRLLKIDVRWSDRVFKERRNSSNYYDSRWKHTRHTYNTHGTLNHSYDCWRIL
jgi:hypothetical protein